MKFNSQICTTKEQSERLLALGLKKETADMVILEHPRKEGRYFYIAKEDANWDGFPAWSLHRLMEIYDKTCIFWSDSFDNPYEAMISRISDKIKWREFNKDYLEK